MLVQIDAEEFSWNFREWFSWMIGIEIPGFSGEISHGTRRFWEQVPALALGRALNTWLEFGISRLLSYKLKELNKKK